MKYRQEEFYVLYRNGKQYRTFSGKTTALQYLGACYDLCPDDVWEVKVCFIPQEVSGDD